MKLVIGGVPIFIEVGMGLVASWFKVTGPRWRDSWGETVVAGIDTD